MFGQLVHVPKDGEIDRTHEQDEADHDDSHKQRVDVTGSDHQGGDTRRIEQEG